jgi:hypothetical protein
MVLPDLAQAFGRLPFEFLASAEVASEIAVGQRRGYRVATPVWASVVELAQSVGALGKSTLAAPLFLRLILSSVLQGRPGRRGIEADNPR